MDRPGMHIIQGNLPEFLMLVLFSLESLITKCLIQRVGAVISGRKKKRREKIKSGQQRVWNLGCNTPDFLKAWGTKDRAISLIPNIFGAKYLSSHLPHPKDLWCQISIEPSPSSHVLLIPTPSCFLPTEAHLHQLRGASQSLLCWEAEWSESRGIEPLHPGIKIFSQEVRKMGQAESLSAASLEEDLKEINQQTNAKKTTETILEETAEPQQILACWDSAPHGKESNGSNVCFNLFSNGFSSNRG